MSSNNRITNSDREPHGQSPAFGGVPPTFLPAVAIAFLDTSASGLSPNTTFPLDVNFNALSRFTTFEGCDHPFDDIA